MKVEDVVIIPRSKYVPKVMPEGTNELGLIFESMRHHSIINRVHPMLSPGPKSCLLCFVDVTVAIEGLGGSVFAIQLRGIEAKVLNGNLHIDPPSEQSPKDQKWYEHFFTQSAASRTALLTFIFLDPQIKSYVYVMQAMVEEAAAAATALAAATPAGASTLPVLDVAAAAAATTGAGIPVSDSLLTAGNPFPDEGGAAIQA